MLYNGLFHAWLVGFGFSFHEASKRIYTMQIMAVDIRLHGKAFVLLHLRAITKSYGNLSLASTMLPGVLVTALAPAGSSLTYIPSDR